MSDSIDEFFCPLEVGDLITYDLNSKIFFGMIGIILEVYENSYCRVYFAADKGKKIYVLHETFLKKITKKLDKN